MLLGEQPALGLMSNDEPSRFPEDLLFDSHLPPSPLERGALGRMAEDTLTVLLRFRKGKIAFTRTGHLTDLGPMTHAEVIILRRGP